METEAFKMLVAAALINYTKMSAEQRVEFLSALRCESGFCEHCGFAEPDGSYCQCTNDE